MPKFAANISMMFPERPFLARIDAAARAGFRAVEMQFPYAFEVDEVAGAVRDAGVACVLINAPPGDWKAGERGLAAVPGRHAAFKESIDRALAYATALGCPRIHVMAGIPPSGADAGACRRAYVANLHDAAVAAATTGRELVIEPINTRDIPGYYLTTQATAHEVLRAVGADNLGVLMDLYHCQVMEGDLATKLREYMAGIGHIQIAGPPERHEPDTGEVNFPYLFALIDSLGYQGWIGAEYNPRGDTLAGLSWLAPYL